jgi:hypothetical protein
MEERGDAKLHLLSPRRHTPQPQGRERSAGEGEVRRAHEKEEGVAEAQRSGEENPWLPAGKE